MRIVQWGARATCSRGVTIGSPSYPDGAKAGLTPEQPADQAGAQDREHRGGAVGRDRERGQGGQGRGGEVVDRGAPEGVDAARHQPDPDRHQGPLGDDGPGPAAPLLPVVRDHDGEHRGGSEHREPGQQGPEQPVRAIAHEDRDQHVRSRRELRQRVAVHELAGRQPAVHGHRLALHLRDHAEPAPHAQEAQPDEGPGEQRQARHHASSSGSAEPAAESVASGPAAAPAPAPHWSATLTATITSTTATVGSRSGPTATKVSSATTTARRPRSEPCTIRSEVTATSPTTPALRPRIRSAAVAPKAPPAYSAPAARRISAPGTTTASRPQKPPAKPARR